MSATIQVIPTLYNGFRCRSRLEARWLVFLDSMEIEYEYEPEGFELPSGKRYLPDLYLSVINCYAEVKPYGKDPSAAFRKCKAFVMAGMGKKALFLVGQPAFRPYLVFRRIELPDSTESMVTNASLDIHMEPRRYFVERRLFEDFDGSALARPKDFSPRYRQAVYRSRAMRFGEEKLA
jgi:hypothetical protein